jgi:hypothetical protein
MSMSIIIIILLIIIRTLVRRLTSLSRPDRPAGPDASSQYRYTIAGPGGEGIQSSAATRGVKRAGLALGDLAWATARGFTFQTSLLWYHHHRQHPVARQYVVYTSLFIVFPVCPELLVSSV